MKKAQGPIIADLRKHRELMLLPLFDYSWEWDEAYVIYLAIQVSDQMMAGEINLDSYHYPLPNLASIESEIKIQETGLYTLSGNTANRVYRYLVHRFNGRFEEKSVPGFIGLSILRLAELMNLDIRTDEDEIELAEERTYADPGEIYVLDQSRLYLHVLSCRQRKSKSNVIDMVIDEAYQERFGVFNPNLMISTSNKTRYYAQAEIAILEDSRFYKICRLAASRNEPASVFFNILIEEYWERRTGLLRKILVLTNRANQQN